MSFWSDMDYEVHAVELDMNTADRLLAGAVAPEDAPPGYAEVARLLEAASAEPTADELTREAEVVAMVAAAVRSSSSSNSSSPRRSFMPFALSRPRISAALVAVAFACSAGLASAGALPGAAQDIASDMLAKVGVSVPGPDDNAREHPSGRGTSADTPSSAGQGSEISELATTTELTGVEKGATISTAASEGKSQAGQHGPGSGARSASEASVTTPNGGGTGTADMASDGKSSTGTSTANTASGGHSAAGSGNASSGQETADTASGGHSTAGSGNASSGQETAETASGGKSGGPGQLQQP
jgi:hypothetical protein